MDIENELFRIILGTVIPMVIAFMAGWIKSKVSEQRHERKETKPLKTACKTYYVIDLFSRTTITRLKAGHPFMHGKILRACIAAIKHSMETVSWKILAANLRPYLQKKVKSNERKHHSLWQVGAGQLACLNHHDGSCYDDFFMPCHD